jgi:CRP-like cAMP-binding protein
VTTSTHDALRNVPLFAGLDDDALAHIAAVAAEFECPPSYVLTERGHPGTGLFIIEEGTVSVHLPSGGFLDRGPGNFVGELALLTDTPRTARVSCTSQVRGLAISRADFAELLTREPSIALGMLSELARRLTEEAHPYETPPAEPDEPE